MERGRKRRPPETAAEGTESRGKVENSEAKKGRGDEGTEVGVIDKGFLGDGKNEVQWEMRREEEGGLVAECNDGETLQQKGEGSDEEQKGFLGAKDAELECRVSIKSPPRSLRKKARVSYNEEVYEFDEDDEEEIPFKKPGRRGRKKKVWSSNRNVSSEEEQLSRMEEADGGGEKKSGVSGNKRGSSRRKRGGRYALRKQ